MGFATILKSALKFLSGVMQHKWNFPADPQLTNMWRQTCKIVWQAGLDTGFFNKTSDFSKTSAIQGQFDGMLNEIDQTGHLFKICASHFLQIYQ